jgi:hypothetical protein
MHFTAFSKARLPKGAFANRSIAKAYRRQALRRAAVAMGCRVGRMRPKIFSQDRILWRSTNVLGERKASFKVAKRAMDNETERTMKRTLIRYKTKPELADRNAELVAAVFAELKTAQPDGVRYLTLRLEDDSFVHFVETAADDGTSALPQLAAFKAFQSGIRDRCAEPPLIRGAMIIGNYRMLEES